MLPLPSRPWQVSDPFEVEVRIELKVDIEFDIEVEVEMIMTLVVAFLRGCEPRQVRSQQ